MFSIKLSPNPRKEGYVQILHLFRQAFPTRIVVINLGTEYLK